MPFSNPKIRIAAGNNLTSSIIHLGAQPSTLYLEQICLQITKKPKPRFQHRLQTSWFKDPIMLCSYDIYTINHHASVQYCNWAKEQPACLGDGRPHLFDWKVMLTLSSRNIIVACMVKSSWKKSCWVGWFVLTTTHQELSTLKVLNMFSNYWGKKWTWRVHLTSCPHG